MGRYDWGWGRGSGRRPIGYGHQYRDWSAPWGMGGRGSYGYGYGWSGSHPQYGGYPGGGESGMYYGGRGGRGPARYGPGPGYDRGFGGGYGGGYGEGGYSRETYVPDDSYGRHSEQERPRHHGLEWSDEPGAPGIDMDDEEVRRSVRESLFNDSWVTADAIDVEVNGGVVTLTGEVADYMEARYAWDDAWETPGVRGVVNQLTVRTDSPSGGAGKKK